MMRYSLDMHRTYNVIAAAMLCVGCSRIPPRLDPDVIAAAAPPTQPAALARLMQISSTAEHSQFVPGNKVTLLQNGPATYAAIIDAIDHATTRIDMESYQFDTQAAAMFAPLLLQKRAQGVAVHLIYDAWGSSEQSKALFQRLRAGGVLVVEYNPIGTSIDLDHRDHRKLLVVDNRIAITGGVNVTGAYLNRTNRSDDPAQMRWRDTDVAIEGPVVDQFETLFLKTWSAQKGPPLPPPPPTPARAPGAAMVQAIDGAPVDDHPVIYETMVAAIALAKHSVHLTTGFFGPPEALLHALQGAGRRGVDVALIVPAHNTSEASRQAGRSHYHELLDAGVHVFERENVVLHAKTAVVDGQWSVVGSSNLDWRSTVLNNEIDAVIVDPGFGAAMEAMFQDDIAHSREITRQEWADRGLRERFDEYWARLVEQEL